jgi:hypothetical protein
MLNLVHIASWISEIFTTNLQEDGKAVGMYESFNLKNMNIYKLHKKHAVLSLL